MSGCPYLALNKIWPNLYHRYNMCFGSTRMHQKWFWKSMSLFWTEKLKIHFYFWLKIGSNDFYNICVKDRPWYNPFPRNVRFENVVFYKLLAQASRTTSGQQKYFYGSWQEVPDHTLSSTVVGFTGFDKGLRIVPLLNSISMVLHQLSLLTSAKNELLIKSNLISC